MSKFDNEAESRETREERQQQESAKRLLGFYRTASEMPPDRPRAIRPKPSFWDRLEWTYYGRW